MNGKARRGMWLGWAGGLLAALLVCSGCNPHPRVTSPEAQDLIKQLYTACNTRSEKRLDDTQAKLDELAAENLLTDQELKSFQSTIDMARGGEWQAAQDRALSFARAQVR